MADADPQERRLGDEAATMEATLPTSITSSLQNQWTRVQDSLRERLVLEDDFSWNVQTCSPCFEDATAARNEAVEEVEAGRPFLRYVGGVDISFCKEDPSIACAALVVLDLTRELRLVYEACRICSITIPYVPGFLAFREAPILLNLLEDMKNKAHPFYPQLLMVDGNGLLHPRGFGLACHLGVIADLPTVGIGKNLHHIDGLSQSRVKKLLQDKANCTKNVIALTGDTGQTWGAAMRSNTSLKPIFISTGHRISLASCIKIVRNCCKFRVPEPVRQADIQSKVWLQKHLKANKSITS